MADKPDHDEYVDRIGCKQKSPGKPPGLFC
jgi:hypothetical protein